MNVNIACGQQKLLGFINVDADPWLRPDVVAVPMDLPFDPGSVSEIHAARVLEHLADPVAALRYWRRLLAADGLLWVSVAEALSACPTCMDNGAPPMVRPGPRGESRPDHPFSPYFLGLCLRAAGFSEAARVVASPYSPPEGPFLLSFRAVKEAPVRRLARRLGWITRQPSLILGPSRQAPGTVSRSGQV